MWWAGAEPVDLYLDTGGWLVSGAAGPTAGDPALPAGAPVDRSTGGASDGPCRGNWSACLDAALASRPPGRRGRTAWRVWLGGELARPFLLPVMPRRTSASDLDAAWQALARHAFQTDRACRVWVGRGGAAAHPGALGVAAAADVVSEIEGWFAQRRLRLCSLAPWWSGVFDAVLAEPLVGPAPGSPAARAGGGVFRVRECGQQHRREHRDDGDDDEKFDEGKGGGIADGGLPMADCRITNTGRRVIING